MILIKVLVVEVVAVIAMILADAGNFFSELPAILLSVATLLTAVGSLIVALRTHRKVDVVQKATNGMQTALLEQTAKASKSEGKEEGKAEEKQEEKDRKESA